MIHDYRHLNESITKTLELILDVEEYSKEQQQGIEQINNAIIELDQQTQKNADVSNTTHDVAIQTKKIAEDIVTDADKKEFIGKNDIIISTKS
jgi:methyl-accepting chemotaxis protein